MGPPATEESVAMEHIRYAAAACQTDLPNPTERGQMRANTDRLLAMIDAALQGASLRHYPPYSWPGGSMAVDFDGRLLAQASPGPGERIVVAPIDISALRHERATRVGHNPLAHLRSEAYPVYAGHRYPPALPLADGEPSHSYERNARLIERAKRSGEPGLG